MNEDRKTWNSDHFLNTYTFGCVIVNLNYCGANCSVSDFAELYIQNTVNIYITSIIWRHLKYCSFVLNGFISCEFTFLTFVGQLILTSWCINSNCLNTTDMSWKILISDVCKQSASNNLKQLARKNKSCSSHILAVAVSLSLTVFLYK